MPASDDSRTPEHPEAGRAWEEANAWLLRVHSGLMSEQEHQDFVAWRRQDAVHEFQFRQAEQFWQALNGLASQVRREPLPREGAALPAEALPASSGWSSRSRRRWRWGMAVAAGLLLAAFAPGLWSIIEFWSADHHTRAGEHATVSLTDGSLVHLNTRSALSVTLSDHRRSLSLKQGEALFEVAHDPARPFEVAVNGRVVRAIGTIFNIERNGHRTIVSVLEGAVRLFDKETAIDIPAGDRVVVDDTQRASAPEPVNTSVVTAWRRHELIFDQMPIEEIVAQMNRYRTDTIIVLGSALRAQQVSGSLALDDPAHSLALLQHTVPFRITHLTPYLTLLSL
ncbi:MAG: FecR domain-containing protein [Nitrospira sp.]|nr:FecR domain-containing protein [Nitrospira sp.]